jgi:hypothetical protein
LLRGQLHLRFGCAFWVCVSLLNALSMSFSVSKTHSVATGGITHRVDNTRVFGCAFWMSAFDTETHAQNAIMIDP